MAYCSMAEFSSNTSRTPAPNFQVGDLVYLSPEIIKTASLLKKLNHKRLGTFQVLEVFNPHDGHLELLPSMKIKRDFDVFLLKPPSLDPFPAKYYSSPSVEIQGLEEWEVEEVLDSHTHYQNLQLPC